MTPPTIAICDSCGSVAWWAVDGAGDVWNLCQNEDCDTHVQLELLPEEPIWKERGTQPVRGDGADGHTQESRSPKVTPPFPLDLEVDNDSR